MNRFMKVMGLCLVAAFVMSAVAAATSSAAKPEFRFTGSKPDFSSKSAAGKLVTSNGEEVTCGADTDTGQLEASGTGNARKILISYTKCTAKILTVAYKCKSSGANEEEIRTNDLSGKLGYIKKATPEVGLLFDPESPAKSFAEFECKPTTGKVIKIKVTGSIIAKIASLNTLVSPGGHFTLTSGLGSGKGEPAVTKFENEAKNVLTTESEGSKNEPHESAIEDTDEVFPLESTEISA